MYVRAEFTAGARLRDPFAQGALAPPSVLVQGSYALWQFGQWSLAPSLGVQVGLGSPFVHAVIQPGVTVHRRINSMFGVHARLDVPLALTRAGVEPVTYVPVPASRPNEIGAGTTFRRTNVPVPDVNQNLTLAPGLEVAAGASLYVRAGLALTAEVIFNGYLGDSLYFYPIVGGGLGVLVDYEILP
ncbi:MAG: hypothetical protein JNK72_03635 [Myxococcales bacterium]|nr:hypothetical protein [Myxococcales bacterium]